MTFDDRGDAQMLRDTATVRAYGRDICDALAALAARPLDEAAAARMRSLIGAPRATEARAALARMRSAQNRVAAAATRPVLRLVTSHVGAGEPAAPPASLHRPTRVVAGGAA